MTLQGNAIFCLILHLLLLLFLAVLLWNLIEMSDMSWEGRGYAEEEALLVPKIGTQTNTHTHTITVEEYETRYWKECREAEECSEQVD